MNIYKDEVEKIIHNHESTILELKERIKAHEDILLNLKEGLSDISD